ncbi:Replication stress response regulator SDE2 [Pseudolycoriella hygida]|uniref:Replication stress response regulator SDE2 n=1 Tax=Pseudolycoriella hygida TaxID=35572 RepID=A0A9Q0MYM5_9DIPT|nr:Replication stress response regulator SDE2 [Pseudolycoriella hygida]
MAHNLYVCQKNIKTFLAEVVSLVEVEAEIQEQLGLKPDDYYLTQNGRRINEISPSFDIHANLRLVGGKGGFGSMLRAIGAQIEKTTNREACRDLSGRRLRDINEEKRLKTWLDAQKDRDQEIVDKRRKKIEKLQAKPKHCFKDEAYEQARADMTQNVADSVEEGFRAAEQQKINNLKRSAEGRSDGKIKKAKKGALWLDDISSSSDTDDSDSDSDSKPTKPAQQATSRRSASCPSTSSVDVSEDTSNSSSSVVDK